MREPLPLGDWEPTCAACGKTALQHRAKDVQFSCPEVNSEVELLRQALFGVAPIAAAALQGMAVSVAPAPDALPVIPAEAVLVADGAARELLQRFVMRVGGECQRDHHGYCQGHFLERECTVEAARAFLALSNDTAVRVAETPTPEKEGT